MMNGLGSDRAVPVKFAATQAGNEQRPRTMNETHTLFNGRWLRLVRSGRWEYAQRTNPGGGVIIIAITPGDRILFVEQWREAVHARTIEMPAGLVGDMHGHRAESALTAALRELTEETGYRAGNAQMLVAGPSSAGMSDEIITFVRARDLVREHDGGGDSSENIVVHEIPRREAAQWLVEKMRAGYPVDPKLFAGLYFIDHHDELFGDTQPAA